jgi:hypothetical protein
MPVHLMHGVGVDVNERAERIHRVGLVISVDKPILLIRGKFAVLAAHALSAGVIVVTRDWWLVVVPARSETRVLVGVRDIRRRPFRRIVSIYATIRIPGIVRRAPVVVVLSRMVIVDVSACLVRRPLRVLAH